MPVTVHIPEPLRRYSNGADAFVVTGATVGDALDALFAELPDLRARVVDERDDAVFPYLILMAGDREVARTAWRDVALGDGAVVSIVPAVEGGSGDVRMRGFERRSTVEEARRAAFAGLEQETETIPAAAAAGRVLALDVTSAVDVPPFDRSAMDGFAVLATDTFGATRDDPVELEVVGESMPGAPCTRIVASGSACRIMTGAPMPAGADAVVMAEDVRDAANPKAILVEAPVTPKKNVGRRGEDITAGDVVLRAGRRLRPQDAAILCSIGAAAPVVRRPRAGILATGNELLAPGEAPREGRIVDSNTPMLDALARRDGADVAWTLRLPDDPDAIRAALVDDRVEVLLCTGGSSVGREDWLPVLVRDLGDLPVHGVAMRPSAPTGIGTIGSRRVFLLPGNPVSCLCAYDFFAGPAIRRLGGRDEGWPYPLARGRLTRRISSLVGRVDYVRVVRDGDGFAPLATSGASILSSTTRADGFVVIGEDSEGSPEGDAVDVRLYDRGPA